uniref:Mediator of RNA polymerase II transcription subunit 14 n=1 Tax=Spongospora subterranea TaxID=70186 RepID=A0A0H5RB92_9EUKA|eukprot:CRZ10887.1 hypothetical protein [Spongospora subterranea]
MKTLTSRCHITMDNICSSLVKSCKSIPLSDDNQHGIGDRQALYKYFQSTRQWFFRILMIVQWVSRSVTPLEQLTSLNEFINRTNRVFRKYAHRMRLELSAQMERHLYPAWDVPTAMHMLCYGRYPWFNHRPGLGQSRQALTDRLSMLVRAQFASSLLPATLHLTASSVQDGKLSLRSANDFALVLSLRLHGRERGSTVYWCVLSAKIKDLPVSNSLQSDCNAMLSDHSSPETALADLCEYLRLYLVRQQFAAFKQEVDLMVKNNFLIGQNVSEDRLTLELHYWPSDIVGVPVPGHIPWDNDAPLMSNSVLLIVLNPPSVQFVPDSPHACALLKLMTPLSDLVVTARRVQSVLRLQQLHCHLTSASIDLVFWASLSLQDDTLEIALFDSEDRTLFVDGLSVSISVAPEDGAFTIRCFTLESNPFWSRLLGLFTRHLNESPIKIYQILAALSINAVIEHFSLLANVTGHSSRRNNSDELGWLSLCVPIPHFPPAALVISLNDGELMFNLYDDIKKLSPKTADELDFNSLLQDWSVLKTSVPRNRKYLRESVDVMQRLSPSLFCELVRTLQCRLMQRVIKKELAAAEVVALSARFMCVRMCLPEHFWLRTPLYVIVRCPHYSHYIASVDCSVLGARFVSSAPFICPSSHFNFNASQMCMDFCYPFEDAKKLRYSTVQPFRDDIHLMLGLIDLSSQFLKISREHRFISDHFQIRRLSLAGLCVGYRTDCSILIVPKIVHGHVMLSPHFSPKDLPQRSYLEHELNSGLLGFLRVLHSSYHMTEAVLRFLYTSNVVGYIGPDIDVVPQSCTCLRLVYRNIKLSIQLWIDLRFLADNIIVVEHSSPVTSDERLSGVNELLEFLDSWRTKCNKHVESSSVAAILKQKNNPRMDSGLWCQNGIEFVVDNEGIVGLETTSDSADIQAFLQYYQDHATGNHLTGFARLCYAPGPVFHQVALILQSIQENSSPKLLRVHLLLQCRQSWTYSRTTQSMTLFIEFQEPLIGSCVVIVHYSIIDRLVSLGGRGGDANLLQQYLLEWDRTCLASAVDLLRRRSLIEIAKLRSATSDVS